MHCNNYVCKLESGCACRCDACRPVCKSCGACQYCGASSKEKEIVYIPYPVLPTYYCSRCYTYHLVGYTCYIPYTKYVQFQVTSASNTIPYTITNNSNSNGVTSTYGFITTN